MSTDSCRLELCRRCIDECYWLGGGRWSLYEGIRTMLTDNAKWMNPFYFGHIDSYRLRLELFKVCYKCPYILEHTMIAGEEVYEQER